MEEEERTMRKVDRGGWRGRRGIEEGGGERKRREENRGKRKRMGEEQGERKRDDRE